MVEQKYGPNNPPRLRHEWESVEAYRVAMGWDQPKPQPENTAATDLSDAQLKQLCEALGWQGGTFHQVLDEVKRLRAHGVGASDRGVNAQQTPIPSPMDYEGEG